MTRRSSVVRSGRALAAVIMVAGLVVGGADAGAADSRMLAAPVGVWSGPGDQQAGFDDYDILVIMAGAAGSQQAFWAEYQVGGPCALGEGVFDSASMLGTAWMDPGGTIHVVGDLLCSSSANRIDGIELHLGYDAPSGNLLPPNGYPSEWLPRCTGANSTIVGTPGDDLLVGTSGHDVIDGLGGNDVLRGKGGMDILCGQGGKDKLIGGGSIDALVGGGKKDRLNGGPGWDLLLGEGGPDILKGRGGDDSMFGGRGGDTLEGGGGNDFADGGGGSDTCSAETQVSC